MRQIPAAMMSLHLTALAASYLSLTHSAAAFGRPTVRSSSHAADSFMRQVAANNGENAPRKQTDRQVIAMRISRDPPATWLVCVCLCVVSEKLCPDDPGESRRRQDTPRLDLH